MTRLFIRFYLGVIAILIGAWLIQSYVGRERSETQNIRVVEQALSGGVRLARDELAASSSGNEAQTMKRIQDRFEYPVQRVGLNQEWLSVPMRERLRAGEVVFTGNQVAIALTQHDVSEDPDRDVLLFGPLPQFVGPSQSEVTFGYGVVFLLAAIAIAFLLRPVAFQMRAVERTAAAISQGDLSARIDDSEAPKELALVRAFNSMADRTETLLRSQRELLQAVSHELRTPLARIRFAADLVETAKSDEERRTRLDAIDSATQKLDDLVSELMTYVRIESDAPLEPPEAIDVNHLLAELIDIHAPLNPAIDIQQVDENRSIVVTSNRDSLSRATENLLRNAARHARNQVRLHAANDAREISITVEDDGEGVPPEDRHRIFDPFVRLDNSSEPGTGLGLALVARIARRHRGDIEVTDSPLGGACFTFRLPK